MKKIFKLLLVPALVLPLLFTSCADDNDSNPTLDLSHVSDGFVLNTPAYSSSTYDLVNAENLTLSCSQPNYGGIPYTVRYFVQVALTQDFAKMTELPTSYTTALMNVSASELNDALVDLYQDGDKGKELPASMSVYIRLRAIIDGGNDATLGQTYSNAVNLPNVKAVYQAPDVSYDNELYVVGSSIQEAWKSWKKVAPVYGMPGNFYTIIYVPAGGSFKWGAAKEDWRGYNAISTINDKAGAGVSESEGNDHNIVLANGGWYTLHFAEEIAPNKKTLIYTLNIYPASAHVIGYVAGGAWNDGDPDWALTAPADASGNWESPVFAGGGELRAYIKVPGFDWWRTEFTINAGNLYWRNVDIPNNWAESLGADYSVTCAAGQKLYVNFDKNTAEVK